MSTLTVDDVQFCLDEFRDSLVPERFRDAVRLSKPYELFDGPHGPAHWPKTWGAVWEVDGNPGVYLHFDVNDQLIYVGKAVSLGQRLGCYFGYAADRSCEIKDSALANSVRVRAVVLEGDPLKFLVPALEWFLIDRLSPVVNRQHKRVTVAE
jgi:hypothetical protein